MPYQFVNQVTVEQIQQLANPIQAETVLEEMAAIAEQSTPTKGNQVDQWLKQFQQYGIVAQKGGAANSIEVSPSGSDSPDRIEMTAADGIATVTGVKEAIR